jgi:hypothetical protein
MKLLWKTLPALPAVFPVGFSIWLIFAILGTQLYSGKFSRCNDETITDRFNCTGQFLDPKSGLLADREWMRPEDNYNDVAQGLFTGLFTRYNVSELKMINQLFNYFSFCFFK